MANEIFLMPEEAKGEATAIKSEAEEILANLEQVKTHVNNLGEYWKGASYDSFLTVYGSVAPQLDAMAKEAIPSLSDAIQQVVDNIVAVDEQMASSMNG